MSVNRLNFGDLAPAPSASMTRTTHSKKPHVHRCVSGCVNNFGDRTGNQRAVETCIRMSGAESSVLDLFPQVGVEQQVNGTRLSTRGQARGGAAAPCIRMALSAHLMGRCWSLQALHRIYQSSATSAANPPPPLPALCPGVVF
jgi:hypothetical protein